MSIATSELILRHILQQRAGDFAPDWACWLLKQGHETSGLISLAGAGDWSDPWQLDEMLETTFEEMGISLPRLRADPIPLLGALVQDVLNGRLAQGHALELFDLAYSEFGMLGDLFNFSVLADAKRLLREYRSTPYGLPERGWRYFTRRNVDRRVHEEARLWLKEHGYPFDRNQPHLRLAC